MSVDTPQKYQGSTSSIKVQDQFSHTGDTGRAKYTWGPWRPREWIKTQS